MKQRQFPITIKILYEEAAADAPYIAYIPEFDVSSCGQTEAEAISHVKEALDIVLEEVQKKGQLDEFLAEQGFPKEEKNIPQFPKLIIEPFTFPIQS